MSNFSLMKSEILRYKKSVEELFEQRKGFIQFPLRCVYRYTMDQSDIDALAEQGGGVEIKVLFVVGKKYNKRAVKRNVVRRRIKEAYRLNKHIIYNELSGLSVSNVDIALLYVGKQEHNYGEIENCVIKILNNVSSRIKKNINSVASSVD